MEIVFLRHATAEDRAGGERPDAERALTDVGRREARRAGRALRRLVREPVTITASPLVRARETAELVARAYGGVEPVELPALAPGGAQEEIARWLAALHPNAAAILVGHEPDLSITATWLLTGLRTPILSLGKAGACLLELPDEVAPGRAQLCWSLRPGQLRALR